MAGWHALAVLVPRPLARAVSDALVAIGATGTQEDLPPGVAPKFRQPWERGPAPRAPRRVLLRAWFSVRPDTAVVHAALDGRGLDEPRWTWQVEEDWAEDWKANFTPLRISDRLTIAAPWHLVPGALEIEPGNAFGTGEHPTTRACLVAIDRLAKPGATLLDVGCGSGILALAGAKLGMVASGIDTDPDAVVSAQGAARHNDLPAAFSGTPLAQVAGTYDLVVANLFAEVLVALAPDLLRVAAGPLVCAGILADRAHTVRSALGARRVDLEATDGDWTAFVFAPP